jgi:hypothetical protein
MGQAESLPPAALMGWVHPSFAQAGAKEGGCTFHTLRNIGVGGEAGPQDSDGKCDTAYDFPEGMTCR